MNHKIFSLLLILTMLTACGSDDTTQTTVYQGRVLPPFDIYRLPSLVKTSNGTLLAFAEKRPGFFDDGDKDVVVKRSFDNGDTWSDLIVIDSNEKNSSSNPAPIYDEINDRVVLVFSHFSGSEVNASDNRLYVSFSDDDGATWTERKDISSVIPNPDKLFLPGPGHAIQLQHPPYVGRLVVPAWAMTGYVQLIYSDDFGDTWHLGAQSTAEAVGTRINETTITELNNGAVYVVARNAGGDSDKVKSENVSYDGGVTFAQLFTETDKFPGPVVQGALLTFSDDLILFSTPTDNSSRKRMGIIASNNSGETWGEPLILSDDAAAYNDMAKIDENTVGVLVESWTTPIPYSRIVYINVDINDIPMN